GEALGQRLEGRSVRSARRVLKKRFDLDLAELPDAGVLVKAKARPAGKVSLRALDRAQAGNVLITPSMARAEFLDRNPHLRAATGGAALRVHPDDAAALDLRDGEVVRLRAGGVLRE